MRSGANLPDEQHIREQKTPEKSFRRGVFMRNMTAGEFMAKIHRNLGVIHSERKDFAMAAREYESTLSLERRMPAAWGNLANDLLRHRKLRRAIRLISKSLWLCPDDVWALDIRGLAHLRLGMK